MALHDGDASQIDAGPSECNAIENLGCWPERCTFLHPSETDDQYVRICAPTGSLPEGAQCAVEPGEPDDCIARTLCFWGRCRPLCNAVYPCADGACGATITEENIGFEHVCYPGCDPLQPDCIDSHACYFHTGAPETGQPACFPAGLGQRGESCTWSDECETGLVCAGSTLAPFDTSADNGTCSAICDSAGDDCEANETCAAFEEASYGACVPAD